MWILAMLNVRELVIALDTTHAFKSENNKWGIKILILREYILLAYLLRLH